MIKRVEAKVFGRVQGVYYRAFTQKKALELGLKGYVRNLSDGSVEVIAEGEEQNLKKLIEVLYVGPPAAKVEKIEKNFCDAKNEFSIFSIKY